jgi:hypothetical protein
MFELSVTLSVHAGDTHPETNEHSTNSPRVLHNDMFPDPTDARWGLILILRYISLQLTLLRNSKRKRRNDFYITLESGSFSQDMKNSARNVEINCLFVDADGQLHNCIRRCSTNPGESSPVYFYPGTVTT